MSNNSSLPTPIPYTVAMEEAVVGQLLANPKLIAEVVGSMLEPSHFYGGGERLLYSTLYESYYADDPIDPLSVGQRCAKQLAVSWQCSEDDAIAKVQELAQAQRWQGKVTDHADVVKRDFDMRALLSVAGSINRAVADGTKGPEEIASMASQDAMQIATSAVKVQERISYGDLGREFVRDMKKVMAAKQQGIELGARFGYGFIDDWTYGIQPTELLLCAGTPGSGKTIVWTRALQNFAERQNRLPKDKQIGSMIFNLEMGVWPSSIRLAQMAAGIPGRLMRTGELTHPQLSEIVNQWGKLKDIPLDFNFASSLRLSQLRALVVEAIRHNNVGVIMLDHIKMLDTDTYIRNEVERDEVKVRFLKEQIAEDLNVAVICLAHTVKLNGLDQKRPKLEHLRGSYQIAAHADHVCFIHRPNDQDDIAEGADENQAEMIVEKNRHEKKGIFPFYLDASQMKIA